MNDFHKLILNVSSNSIAVNIIRIFKMGSLMKRLYYQLNTIRNQTKSLSFQGIRAKFYINNFEELRAVETALDKGCNDERNMLVPILQTLKQGDVAYDIGANIGIYTIFLAKKVGNTGKIITFEPDSRNFDSLKKNININQLNNVFSQKVALGDKDGKGTLYINKRVGIGAISLIETESGCIREQAKIVKGDTFIKKMKFAIPTGIKIDVEGYEYLVLKGLKKTLSNDSCRLVCCEIHSTLIPSGIKKEDVLDLLRTCGFNEINTYSRGSEIHAICYKNRFRLLQNTLTIKKNNKE